MADTIDPKTLSAMAAPVLIRFVQACDDWQLTSFERMMLAGLPDPTEWSSWLSQAHQAAAVQLPENLLLRVGAVAAIHDRLSRLLPAQTDRLTWLFSVSRGPLCRGSTPWSLLSDTETIIVLDFRERFDAWVDMPHLTGVSFRRAA